VEPNEHDRSSEADGQTRITGRMRLTLLKDIVSGTPTGHWLTLHIFSSANRVFARSNISIL
jgi:hypothetical protein